MSNIKLFKFKSAENAQKLDHILEIIENQRLHCSERKNLNDPMEGAFSYYGGVDTTEFVNEKNKFKICSLTSSDKYLLWVYYACGFNGVAIEMVFPSNHKDLKKIRYQKQIPLINPNADKADTVKMLLTNKLSVFRHECEYRIISYIDFYSIETPIKRVILGHKLSSEYRTRILTSCCMRGIEVLEVDSEQQFTSELKYKIALFDHNTTILS